MRDADEGPVTSRRSRVPRARASGRNGRGLGAALVVALLAVAPVRSQAPAGAPPFGTRAPAGILPADRAGILLMETRAELERPEEILDRMGLEDGDLVADLGCGNGYYSLRLARRVGPRGVVFAVDIQEGMLAQLRTRAAEAGITNIHPVLGTATDPMLPDHAMDWILMVDVYHELSDPAPMLERIRTALATGGRVALLEYRAEQDPGTMPAFIPRSHKMTVHEVVREWIPAGFRLVGFHEFLPAQHYFVFEAEPEAAP